MLVNKVLHGGLEIIGGDQYIQGLYGIYTGGNSQVGGTFQGIGAARFFSTLTADMAAWFKNNTTIGEPAVGTSSLTVYGMINVPPGAGFTTGLLIERDASFVGNVDINGDLDIDIGHTLKVDNILKADPGLGTLDIEGISLEGTFLYVDDIAEKTTANGIRIDQLRIKDNTLNNIVPGTEIIVEEDLRIRDPHKLEVSNIYEADLSSDITFHSRTIIDSNLTVNYQFALTNLAVGSNHQVLMVDTAGSVSAPALLTVLTSTSPDKLFINGDVQINSGPGTGGKIDLTNGFGRIYNETATYADANTHSLLTGIYTGALFLVMYAQTTHPPAAEIKGAYLAAVMYDSSSGTVRVRTTLLGETGASAVIGYTNDNATSCDLTVRIPSGVGVVWSLLRI